MWRLRAGMNAPQPPGGAGAPLGGTTTSREELADRGRALRRGKRGPDAVRRYDGAPPGAHPSPKGARASPSAEENGRRAALHPLDVFEGQREYRRTWRPDKKYGRRSVGFSLSPQCGEREKKKWPRRARP